MNLRCVTKYCTFHFQNQSKNALHPLTKSQSLEAQMSLLIFAHSPLLTEATATMSHLEKAYSPESASLPTLLEHPKPIVHTANTAPKGVLMQITSTTNTSTEAMQHHCRSMEAGWNICQQQTTNSSFTHVTPQHTSSRGQQPRWRKMLLELADFVCTARDLHFLVFLVQCTAFSILMD